MTPSIFMLGTELGGKVGVASAGRSFQQSADFARCRICYIRLCYIAVESNGSYAFSVGLRRWGHVWVLAQFCHLEGRLAAESL